MGSKGGPDRTLPILERGGLAGRDSYLERGVFGWLTALALRRQRSWVRIPPSAPEAPYFSYELAQRFDLLPLSLPLLQISGRAEWTAFHHTRIVRLTDGKDLSELDKFLAEEEDKGYELYSLTELTNMAGRNPSSGEIRLLVVTKRK